MSDINLTELLGNFERCCFQLAKQDSYEDYDDYLQTVYNHCANKLVDVFGSDRNILKRRIDEYIKDFYYRDPNTNIQKTFLEWSDFFNSEYQSKENLFELYDICAKQKKEIDSYKQKIKEFEEYIEKSNQKIADLKSHLEINYDDEDYNTDTHSKITPVTPEQTKCFLHTVRAVGKLGYTEIKCGAYEFKTWCDRVIAQMGNFFKECLGWDDKDINDFLGEMWELKFRIGDEVHTIKEWAEIEKNKRIEERSKNRKTYYVTRNTTEIHPTVFSIQKAERMEDYLIWDMLKLLMIREYEEYGAKDAMEQINYKISISSELRGAFSAPKPQEGKDIPNEKDIDDWIHELYFFTDAGVKLMNQEGAKLYPVETEREKWLTEEAMLSDFLETL